MSSERARRESGHAIVEALPYDRVAAKAYELYLKRGREDGRELEDWLEAERSVRVEVAAERTRGGSIRPIPSPPAALRAVGKGNTARSR